MIILVGKPGSGKSFFAYNSLNKVIINQDSLGDRKKCIDATKLALSSNKDVIIDRTNINKQQRSIWINIAKEYNVTEIYCIEFKVSAEECIKRIQNRLYHPTIKENTSLEKITDIVRKFEKSYEEPSISEGFISITHINSNSIL